MDTEYQKKCPQCKLHYEANRLNQKFCSIKCKARYNNAKARKVNEKRERITGSTNNALWKNRQILKDNVDNTFTKKAMEKADFAFNYITSFGIDEKGRNHLYCYDYGYYFKDEETVKIFKA